MIKGKRWRQEVRRSLSRQNGTRFEKKVWRALLLIPSGEVRTYGWLAKKIGHPGAYRAVGNALNKNPLAPDLPCHRVIAANGIGGYAKGLRKKRRLLRREGVIL